MVSLRFRFLKFHNLSAFQKKSSGVNAVQALTCSVHYQFVLLALFSSDSTLMQPLH